MLRCSLGLGRAPLPLGCFAKAMPLSGLRRLAAAMTAVPMLTVAQGSGAPDTNGRLHHGLVRLMQDSCAASLHTAAVSTASRAHTCSRGLGSLSRPLGSLQDSRLRGLMDCGLPHGRSPAKHTQVSLATVPRVLLMVCRVRPRQRAALLQPLSSNCRAKRSACLSSTQTRTAAAHFVRPWSRAVTHNRPRPRSEQEDTGNQGARTHLARASWASRSSASSSASSAAAAARAAASSCCLASAA